MLQINGNGGPHGKRIMSDSEARYNQYIVLETYISAEISMLKEKNPYSGPGRSSKTSVTTFFDQVDSVLSVKKLHRCWYTF